MDINELLQNPEYGRLEELATMHHLDLGIMQEMAIGVADRLEAVRNSGVEPTEDHVIAAISSWFAERQAITERYFNDPSFRIKLQGQVYDQLKAEVQNG